MPALLSKPWTLSAIPATCVWMCPAAAPGDRYEVRVKYFHPMHFDTLNGRYVLDLPTVVPKVSSAQLQFPCSRREQQFPCSSRAWPALRGKQKVQCWHALPADGLYLTGLAAPRCAMLHCVCRSACPRACM